MSAHCCHDAVCPTAAADPRWRQALWVALLLNAGMFVVELGAAWRSGSVSLLADSIDFFGDAGNYAISLAVLGMGLAARARAALFKAACMGGFGVFVLGRALWTLNTGAVPEPATMGAVGLAALAVNAGVAWMLYRFRTGDANMRSVWICSRNDALGNIAVVLAALGVFGTGRAWPDLCVAVAMAGLALSGAWSVARQALAELRAARAVPPTRSAQPMLVAQPGAPVPRSVSNARKAAAPRPADTASAPTPQASSARPNSQGASACATRAGTISNPCRWP